MHTGAVSELTPTAPDEVRVGDAERRAVDALLHTAVGDGVLTLDEYEERCSAVWAARTRGDLAAVVRDLPGAGAVREPGRAAGSAAPVPARRRRRACLAALAVAGVVAVASAGGSGGDGGGVGDRTLFPDAGETVAVRGGVGDVTVVVPDGVRAVLQGERGVGDVDCDSACLGGPEEQVTIVLDGGVGDVEVETASEHRD